MKYGSYHICQFCLGPIFRNGILVQKKKGRGWEKEGKFYHKGCWKKVFRKIIKEKYGKRTSSKNI